MRRIQSALLRSQPSRSAAAKWDFPRYSHYISWGQRPASTTSWNGQIKIYRDLLLWVSLPPRSLAAFSRPMTITAGSCFDRNLVLVLAPLICSSNIGLMSKAEAISSNAFIPPALHFMLNAPSRESHSPCSIRTSVNLLRTERPVEPAKSLDGISC